MASDSNQIRSVCDSDKEELSMEEMLSEAESAMKEFFSVQAPRDILCGLWTGAMCIVSGAVLATVGIVAQPVDGIRSSGVTGGIKGVAAGLCTAVFFSVVAVCTCAFQICRGAIATPRALLSTSRGLQWDSESAKWTEPIPYSLPEEAERVLKGDDDDDDGLGCDGDNTGRSSASSSRRQVVDTRYYDALCVPTAASTQDIRRGYFKQSKRWHPDKASEPDAKQRFQQISEAYQVLSDPKRRRAYDAHGRQGAGENFIDAQIFFSALFHADVLEPFIGQLRLAETLGEDFLNVVDESNNAESKNVNATCFSDQIRESQRNEARQVRRQVTLAVKLTELLDPYVKGDRAGFVKRAQFEARSMLAKDKSIGRFLEEIGWMYGNRANWYLGQLESRLGTLGLRAVRARTQLTARGMLHKATTAKLAVSSYFKLRDISREVATEDGATDGVEGTSRAEKEEEFPDVLTNALPTFMETLWSLTANDIVGTLDTVVARVLKDSSVDMASRRRRAEGLQELSRIFTSEAKAAASAPTKSIVNQTDNHARQRFEEAIMASMGARPTES